jgi:hypothetical protein
MRIRMDPRWFGSLDPDPDPHSDKKLATDPVRIETNTDTQHWFGFCLLQPGGVLRNDQASKF